jgi:CubicO group peptidase (beta-lactamase class C family)
MDTIAPEKVGFSTDRLGRVHPVMQAYVDQKKLPGVIALVSRRGKVVHFEWFGLMDIESNKPMQADTIFRIYSMTKPITSVAMMMLYEEGRFQLDDPISKFIPAFTDVKVFGKTNDGKIKLSDLEREITIRDLMTHTSGLTYASLEASPVAAMYQEAGLLNRDRTLQENVQELVKLPLVNQPGTVWRYSVSTDVLGHLVELIANMPFDAFLEQRIIAPLHMTDTGFYVPKEKIDRFAALYSPADNGRLELTDPPATGEYSKPPSLFSGGGGLVSTTTDYVQFAQMMLNGGELDGTRLLGRKTIEFMTTNHISDQLMPLQIAHDWVLHGYGYGLGFGVIMNVAQSQVLGSSNTYGWGGAASTHFWIDPKEELLGVIMTQLSPIYYYPIEQQFKVLTYQALVD